MHNRFLWYGKHIILKWLRANRLAAYVLQFKWKLVLQMLNANYGWWRKSTRYIKKKQSVKKTQTRSHSINVFVYDAGNEELMGLCKKRFTWWTKNGQARTNESFLWCMRHFKSLSVLLSRSPLTTHAKHPSLEIVCYLCSYFICFSFFSGYYVKLQSGTSAIA